MAFSPDGRLLAIDSALIDYTDPEHPRQIATLNQTGDVLSLAFSPDSHALATTGDDRTTHLWDLTDPHHPAELATLNQPDTPTSVAFSPDGHTIATGGTDHTLRIWDTDIPRLTAHLCSLAHTPITLAEWNRYLPELPYRPPCP